MGNCMDIAVLVSILVAGYVGLRLGGIRALSLGSGAGAGILIASHQYQEVAPYFAALISDPELAERASFSALAVGVFVAALVLGIVIRRILGILFLGWLDGASGFAIGMSLALFAWFLALGYAVPFLTGELREAAVHSRTTRTMLAEVPRIIDLVPGPVGEFLGSAKDRLESTS